jgi:cytoskeletal protein CcmA (bactofilin family)
MITSRGIGLSLQANANSSSASSPRLGDVRCPSLVISSNAQVVGSVTAERVVVNGKVEGPIQGGDVVLKSKAHVVGDIRHKSLTIEKGASFEGRATQAQAANGSQPEKPRIRTLREAHEADAAAG